MLLVAGLLHNAHVDIYCLRVTVYSFCIHCILSSTTRAGSPVLHQGTNWTYLGLTCHKTLITMSVYMVVLLSQVIVCNTNLFSLFNCSVDSNTRLLFYSSLSSCAPHALLSLTDLLIIMLSCYEINNTCRNAYTHSSSSIRVYGVNVWNSIPRDLRNTTSLKLFRTKYKLYLINN